MIQYTYTINRLGLPQYDFTYNGITGFAVHGDEFEEYFTFHVFMQFPLGQFVSVQKISKQLLRMHESDAIERIAQLCQSQYERKIQAASQT